MSRHRFDHDAARAFYVALDPRERTDARVAEEFGVTDRTIAKWRKHDRWEQLAERIDGQAADKALARATRTREQRAAQVLRIFDLAANRVENALDPEEKAEQLAVDVVFARFPEIHRIYRLEIGEATDHVALAEVQAGFRTAMQVAIQIVDELMAELLAGTLAPADLARTFRARFLPAVNEALAVGGEQA